MEAVNDLVREQEVEFKEIQNKVNEISNTIKCFITALMEIDIPNDHDYYKINSREQIDALHQRLGQIYKMATDTPGNLENIFEFHSGILIPVIDRYSSKVNPTLPSE